MKRKPEEMDEQLQPQRLSRRTHYPPGAHPRRPPAHRSVSLLHSPRFTSSGNNSGAGSTLANPSSSPPSQRGMQKTSSGESSNAEHWFSTHNNNPKAEAPIFSDEPPFFLQNSSSSERTPPEPNTQHRSHAAMLPYRTGVAGLGNHDSSSEDYRGVIDDLTIENKKLKKRLKKYEQSRSAHLDQDKLFEIKINGLPPDKKRELEEYLKKFTMDLENGPATNTTSSAKTGSSAAASSSRPSLKHTQTKSSYTSQFADSAYVSHSGQGVSHSGQGSSAQSGPDTNDQAPSKSIIERQKQQQQSIQNYLHEIPEGLLPQPTKPMSEKARKKMVVRRLEQIFAGRGAAEGGHQQPQQQQEVAQSAAKAERTASEAAGRIMRAEGHREARIMPKRAEQGQDNEQMSAMRVSWHTTQQLQASEEIEETDFADRGNVTPDQRPTRPLDLDPYRAQVPMDNLEYLRHLGFSPPDLDGPNSPMDGHGWIYLNVLVNMAQLHTVNVTAEFVRRAVTEYSKKFELSSDGRKIRWKGGHGVTRTSSDDNSPEHGVSGAGARYGSGSRVIQSYPTQSGSGQSKSVAYVPLFAHKDESDSEMESSEEYTNSPVSSPFQGKLGASSGFNSSGMQTSTSKKRRGDNGPIIFYHRAKFITDLSGDPGGVPQKSSHGPHYHAIPTAPLGTAHSQGQNADSADVDMDEAKGPLTACMSPLGSIATDESSSIPSDKELYFEPAPLRGHNSESGFEQPKAMELQASGLFDVRPEDNFAIDVRSLQIPLLDGQTAASFLSHPLVKAYPKRIREILKQAPSVTAKRVESIKKHKQPFVGEKVISAEKRSLKPSELPEASYLQFSKSEDETDSDEDVDMDSEDSEHESATSCRPTVAPQLVRMPTTTTSSLLEASNDEIDYDDDESEDDDESVDFLATARKADPAAIRAQERLHDGDIADRLAEEIPAGSSAATAGGGSGFNSPMSVDGAEKEAQQTQNQTEVPSLKRARTSDSMIVHGKAPRVE